MRSQLGNKRIGGNNSGTARSQAPTQRDLDKKVLADCKAEAKAAADAKPSPAPDANSILSGIIVAGFTMIFRGASVANAGKGFAVGAGSRAVANTWIKSRAYSDTYQACMANHGVFLPDVSFF